MMHLRLEESAAERIAWLLTRPELADLTIVPPDPMPDVRMDAWEGTLEGHLESLRVALWPPLHYYGVIRNE